MMNCLSRERKVPHLTAQKVGRKCQLYDKM